MVKKKRVFVVAMLFILINISSLYASSNKVEPSLEKEFGPPEKVLVRDPLEPYNRAITTFNDRAYFYALKPVAKGYAKVVPEMVRISIDRCFNNLEFPIRLVNNLLQLKIKGAGIESARFVINSTIGIAGFGDPAKKWFHLEPHEEDFGQTLGYYKMGSVFYIVWPFIGPSDLRDTIGKAADIFTQPATYLVDWWILLAARAFQEINYTSLHIGEYETMKKEALDYYTFMRDAYEQMRIKEIKE